MAARNLQAAPYRVGQRVVHHAAGGGDGIDLFEEHAHESDVLLVVPGLGIGPLHGDAQWWPKGRALEEERPGATGDAQCADLGARILSGRALAWGPPILAEAAALGRSIAFAWAIGPEELGRAMLLALAVRLVEMAGDVGIERLVVQAPDGATARLQAELHGAALLRGVALALLLLVALIHQQPQSQRQVGQ